MTVQTLFGPEHQRTRPKPIAAPPTFDAAAGKVAKEAGIDSAAHAADKETNLQLAQKMARHLAREHGTVTSDDVHMHLMQIFPGWSPSLLGPAAGGIFRGADWQFTGERRRSTWAPNHGRELKVWRLDIVHE